MAAPAAILLFIPRAALAEVCDKGDLFGVDFDIFRLRQSLDPGFVRDAVQIFASPALWLGLGLLLVSIAARARSLAWLAFVYSSFVFLASAVGYLTFNANDQYFQAAVREGCVSTTLLPSAVALCLALLCGLHLRRRYRWSKSPTR